MFLNIRPSAYSRIDSKILLFLNYFKGVITLTTGKNGSRSSKSNGTEIEFECEFLIWNRYLNLVENQSIILEQTQTSQLATAC